MGTCGGTLGREKFAATGIPCWSPDRRIEHAKVANQGGPHACCKGRRRFCVRLRGGTSHRTCACQLYDSGSDGAASAPTTCDVAAVLGRTGSANKASFVSTRQHVPATMGEGHAVLSERHAVFRDCSS